MAAMKKAMMMAMRKVVCTGGNMENGDIMDRIADIIICLAVITIIVLKICGIITISWLWLLAPLWIPFGIGIVMAIIFIILYLIESYIKGE